jgi:hypothetical protein
MLAISKVEHGKKKKLNKKNQEWHARHFKSGTWKKKLNTLNIHARQMKLQTHR